MLRTSVVLLVLYFVFTAAGKEALNAEESYFWVETLKYTFGLGCLLTAIISIAHTIRSNSRKEE